MASASERFASRVGDVSADRAGFGGTRAFTVEVDTVGDNPDDVLRDPDQVGEIAVPFGSPHPTRIGLFSAFYFTEARLAHFVYVVRIVYAPPLVFTTPIAPWEFNYQAGFATSRVNHDVSGAPIGPATYKLFDPNDIPPDPNNTAIYRVTIPGTDQQPPETLHLVRADAPDDDPVREPIFLYNVEKDEPAGSFSMSKTFPGMNASILGMTSMIGNLVNRTDFFGFPAGHVKFVGPTVWAGIGVVPGTTQTQGFVWRITLPFEWNAIGYRFQAQDRFLLSGNELPVVREDGSPVIRNWQLYPEGSLDAIPLLIEQFASHQQPVRLPLIGTVGRPSPIGGGR